MPRCSAVEGKAPLHFPALSGLFLFLARAASTAEVPRRWQPLQPDMAAPLTTSSACPATVPGQPLWNGDVGPLLDDFRALWASGLLNNFGAACLGDDLRTLLSGLLDRASPPRISFSNFHRSGSSSMEPQDSSAAPSNRFSITYRRRLGRGKKLLVRHSSRLQSPRISPGNCLQRASNRKALLNGDWSSAGSNNRRVASSSSVDTRDAPASIQRGSHFSGAAKSLLHLPMREQVKALGFTFASAEPSVELELADFQSPSTGC
ncbi:hypothetical protein Cni_G28689 [Canna indica]|uniref:Uncharacterized protein n=1 Tax=Canna indica TaxID=4628 RepID=A0AAQ3L2Y3_9LILI|nr:hypothetical protein Cni_G28689 [Canna indica]